jgi:hypothetical protein
VNLLVVGFYRKVAVVFTGAEISIPNLKRILSEKYIFYLLVFVLKIFPLSLQPLTSTRYLASLSATTYRKQNHSPFSHQPNYAP